MHINSEIEFATKIIKIERSKFFAIKLSRENANASSNFENSFMNNFAKFNDLFSNKFNDFL